MTNLVSLSLCALLCAPGDEVWESMPSGTDLPLHDVHFVDSQQGWIIGYGNGLLLGTTDAGQRWHELARLRPIYFEQVQFVDANHGWLCGEYGTVMRSADGGKTWADVSPAIADLLVEPFEFEDPPAGVIALYYAMHFSTADEGIVAGMQRHTRTGERSTMILRTQDAGANWTREPAPSGDFLVEIQMLDGDPSGMSIGRQFHQTEDGGQTWTTMEGRLRAVQPRGLFFLEPDVGWSCSFDGKVLRTTNGGLSWTHEQVTRNRLRSIAFLDRNTGFVAGDANSEPGVLWSTTDGGSQWSPVDVEPVDLHRIALTPEAAFVVGKQGVILKQQRSSGEAPPRDD